MSTLAKLVNKKLAIVAMKGAKPVLDAARAKAGVSFNKRTGLLAKSIKARRAKKISKSRALVVIGPTHMKRIMRVTKTGKLRGVSAKKLDQAKSEGARLIPVDPGNYAHLVELGTVHSIAKPFMRPAFDFTKQRAKEVMEKEVGKMTEDLARSLVGVSGHGAGRSWT